LRRSGPSPTPPSTCSTAYFELRTLGVSWATYRSLCEHIGSEPEPWNNINELSANLAHLRPFK
jgi:hypothetical protein